MVSYDSGQHLVPAFGATFNVVVDCLEDRRVHGDSVAFRRGTQLGGLFFGQAQGHGHGAMVPTRYHSSSVAEMPISAELGAPTLDHRRPAGGDVPAAGRARIQALAASASIHSPALVPAPSMRW